MAGKSQFYGVVAVCKRWAVVQNPVSIQIIGPDFFQRIFTVFLSKPSIMVNINGGHVYFMLGFFPDSQGYPDLPSFDMILLV